VVIEELEDEDEPVAEQGEADTLLDEDSEDEPVEEKEEEEPLDEDDDDDATQHYATEPEEELDAKRKPDDTALAALLSAGPLKKSELSRATKAACKAAKKAKKGKGKGKATQGSDKAKKGKDKATKGKGKAKKARTAEPAPAAPAPVTPAPTTPTPAAEACKHVSTCDHNMHVCFGGAHFYVFLCCLCFYNFPVFIIREYRTQITSNSNQIGSAVSQIVLSCTYAIEYNVMSLQVPNFTITKYTNQNNSYLN
jgi:hypothetical protein